jgi:hypothetical protein
MKLQLTTEIPFPRASVFDAYRDHLFDLVPYLPNIRAIDVKSRSEEGPKIKLVNHWRGGADIPAAIRSVLSDSLLEWDDYATWDAPTFTVQWKTVVLAFREALKAEGINRFDEVGPNNTRFTLDGVVEVDSARLPGVARLLGRVVGPALEAFLVATIRPNVLAISKGVERYLREHNR